MKNESRYLNGECVAIPMDRMRRPTPAKEKPGFAQIIRIITAPPLTAGLLLIFLRQAGFFPGASFWMGLLCLTFLPLLAYLVWLVVPSLLFGGRVTQRKTAVAFSVVGYLVGGAYCLFYSVGRLELTVFLTYLLSGILIAFGSKVLKFPISGHACGTAGPIAVLVYARGVWWLMGLIVLAAVIWSSLQMKRHTLPQLLAGAASSVLSMFFWLAVL